MNEWLEPHPIWVVGHRGAPRKARENTFDSFDFAETAGADAIEFDTQQTRDGELVVFHDPDVAIGSARHALRDMHSLDLRSLRLDSPLGEYGIPTLERLFERYGASLRWVIEVKTTPRTDRPRVAARLSELVASFGVGRRCVVASFDADFLEKLHARDESLALSFLVDRSEALLGARPVTSAVGPRHDLVTAKWMSQARSGNLSVHPWTVDDPAEVERLVGLGVASITSNDVEMVRRVLGRG